MSTPTPIAATPATTLTAPTAVASPALAPLTATASKVEDVTAVPKTTVCTPAEDPTGSMTSTTAPPEVSKGVTQLIQELECRRLMLEAQIQKLQSETAKSSLGTATASSSSGISSSSQRCASIPTPTPSLASLPTLPAALQKLVGSGLNTPDLAHLCEQSRVFRTTHSPLMLERRQVTTDLLPHVFNADPEKVKAFFATPAAQKKMVLTKTSYRERYFNKKLNQFVCFRHWKRVSPLQAAALSLDNFLVLDLLSHIENDEVLRLQAAGQLQEVLNRKETTKKVENVNNISTVVISSPTNGTETKVKIEEESKKKAETESADLDIYQAPFQALLKAYEDYLACWETLHSTQNWSELNRLWGNVGECQKKLPTYGLQDFFDNKPLGPFPTYTMPPYRGECRYLDGVLLDLDDIGLSNFYALAKGLPTGARRIRTHPLADRCRGLATHSSVYIYHLCEIRRVELKNIIDCLLKPGAYVTLRADKNSDAVTLSVDKSTVTKP